MQFLTRPKITLFIVLVAMCLNSFTNPSMGQVPAAPRTLWSFLGIPQGARKIHGALFNRRGNFPGLEKKPPLKALADPANLLSENPAIKAAAEIKQEEDLKPQKIKAIKYLASIGCGCYDKEGKITAALVQATQDCTEDVRMTVVEEVAEAAEGECCSNCGMTCCCNEDMVKALANLAYGRDPETGCQVEPSARVREAAARALEICCPNTGPIVDVIEDELIEGGQETQGRENEIDTTEEEIDDTKQEFDTDADAKDKPDETSPQPVPVEESIDQAIDDLQENVSVTQHSSSRSLARLRNHLRSKTRNRLTTGATTARSRSVMPSKPRQWSPTRQEPTENRSWRATRESTNNEARSGGIVKLVQPPHQFRAQAVSTVSFASTGTMIHVDQRRGLAHVHLSNPNAKLSVGDRLTVYQESDGIRNKVGTVEVVQSFKGSANVRAVRRSDRRAIQRGLIAQLSASDRS